LRIFKLIRNLKSSHEYYKYSLICHLYQAILINKSPFPLFWNHFLLFLRSLIIVFHFFVVRSWTSKFFSVDLLYFTIIVNFQLEKHFLYILLWSPKLLEALKLWGTVAIMFSTILESRNLVPSIYNAKQFFRVLFDGLRLFYSLQSFLLNLTRTCFVTCFVFSDLLHILLLDNPNFFLFEIHDSDEYIVRH